MASPTFDIENLPGVKVIGSREELSKNIQQEQPSSLTNEETTKVEVENVAPVVPVETEVEKPVEAVREEIKTPSIQDILREHLGEEYADIELVKSALTKPKETEQEPYVHPSIKELNDKLKEGSLSDINEYLKWSNFDIDSLAEMEKLERYWKDKEQLLDKEIALKTSDYEILFVSPEERQEAIDRGDYTEKDIDRLDAKFDRELVEATRFLKEQKSSKIVELTTPQRQSAEVQEQPNVDLEAQKEAYRNTIISGVENFKPEGFKLVDKVDFVFAPSKEDLAEAKELLSDPSKIFNAFGFVNADGSINTNKMINAFIREKRSKEMLNAAAEQAINIGKDEIIKDVNNVSFDQGKAPIGTIAKDPKAELYKRALDFI